MNRNPKLIVVGLIKALFICGLIWLLIPPSCAHKDKPRQPSFSPPPVASVEKEVQAAQTSTARAQATAKRIAATGAVAGDATVRELVADLEETNSALIRTSWELVSYQRRVDEQTAQLNQAILDKNDALRESEIWKGKQRQALREIWIWRILAGVVMLAVGSYLAWQLYFRPRWL